MTMPQQLEVLMSEEGDAQRPSEADVEELAAEWLDRVVTGAAAMYAQQVWVPAGCSATIEWANLALPVPQVLKIPELGLQGGAQLAADVEYFCNVMSALHGAPSAVLLTVQLFAGQTVEGFVEGAAQAASDGGADMATLRALAGMRRIALP